MKENNKFNILLVAVNFKEKWNKLDLSCKENLAILSLSAFLKQYNYNVIVINAQLEQLSNEEILQKYRDVDFDIIAVSCSPQKLYTASKDFINKAKDKYPNAVTVMGGIFPTLSYKEILKDIHKLDIVSLGEGEFSLLSLCKSIQNRYLNFDTVEGVAYRKGGEIVINSPKRISNLDQLPFPERIPSGFGYKNGLTAYIIAGKGCYGNCSYCSIQSCFSYRKRICRSASNVADEIEMLIRKYSIEYVQFHDDIFYDYSPKNQMWLYDFVNQIEQRKLKFSFRIYLRPNDIKKKEIEMLKRIGLKAVFIGAESGVQRILDEMNKHVTPAKIRESINILKECGIRIHLGFITLVPTMSFEELKENYAFLYDLGSEVCNDANLHNRLNIYYGCEYEKILKHYNLLKESKNFWEIHSYSFRDSKVQKYHDLLQNVKEYARETKILENQLVKSYENDENKIDAIMKYGVEKWIDITKVLLKEVEQKELDEACDLNIIYEIIDDFKEHHKSLIYQ